MLAGLAWHATAFLEVFGGWWREPAGGPLPYIADHVMEPVPVCGKCIDGRGALVSIERQILPGKSALPGVGQQPALGSKCFTPRIGRALETAPGRKLPFRFGRQILSSPGRIRAGVFVSDVNHRMLIAIV